MVALTVDDAFAAVLPPGTIVLGGRAGLGRSVTNTATMRARTPAFPVLRGGEMALVPLALLQLIEPRPRIERLVAQLAEASVAAIVLLEVREDHQALLKPGGAAADEHALPLFVAPRLYTPEAIDVAFHRHLVRLREDLLRRGQELQHELTALALAGRGLPAIVERLAAITGLPAAWEDRALELCSWALPAAEHGGRAGVGLPADLPTVLRDARLPLLRWANSLAPGAHPEVATLSLRADHPSAMSPWKRSVVAFMAGGRVAGYLSLVGRGAVMDQEAMLALMSAGLAASIEALRMRTVSEAQGNAASNLVRDWVTGRFEHTGELAARAAQLGFPSTPPYGVVVLHAEQAITGDLLETLLQAASGAASGTQLPSPVSAVMDEQRTVILAPAMTSATVEAVTGAMRDLLAARSTGAAGAKSLMPVFVGVGRVAAAVEDVPRAYREALQALRVAQRLGDRYQVAYFGALGVYRLLAAVSPWDELRSFYQDVLGPLVAHDHRTGGELLHTLEAYIGCGGSALETAQRLHTHRNTVLYRVDRISKVLSVDLRQPEQRLLLHLALRTGEVLGELGSTPNAPSGASGPVLARTARDRT